MIQQYINSYLAISTIKYIVLSWQFESFLVGLLPLQLDLNFLFKIYITYSIYYVVFFFLSSFFLNEKQDSCISLLKTVFGASGHGESPATSAFCNFVFKRLC